MRRVRSGLNWPMRGGETERMGLPLRASRFQRYVAGRHEVVEVQPAISEFRFRLASYSRYQAHRCVRPKHYGSQVAF